MRLWCIRVICSKLVVVFALSLLLGCDAFAFDKKTTQPMIAEQWSRVAEDRHYHYFLLNCSFEQQEASSFRITIKGILQPAHASEVIAYRQARAPAVISFDHFAQVIADLHIDCDNNLVTIMKTADYAATGERIMGDERQAAKSISDGSVFDMLKQRYCPILKKPLPESSLPIAFARQESQVAFSIPGMVILEASSALQHRGQFGACPNSSLLFAKPGFHAK